MTDQPTFTPLPSNRSFGLLFVVVFTLLGFWQAWKGGSNWLWLWLGLAGTTGFVTAIAPDLLTPFNRAWIRFGLLLHKIVNPIVMGAIFFGVITPAGFLMRALGRDPMQRKYDPEAQTYWIPRQPPGPEPESLRQQF